MANPPVPVERRRRLGNPSGRPLPSPDATGTILPASSNGSAPEPLRPLGLAGRSWWDMILTAGSTWIGSTDIEMVQQIAEQIDEQQALRIRVLDPTHRRDPWRDRSQLRALDEQIRRGMNDLGFTPVARTRMGLAQVTAVAIAAAAQTRERSAGKMFTDDGLADAPTKPEPPEPERPFKSWTKGKVEDWYRARAIEMPEGATKKDLLELAGVTA